MGIKVRYGFNDLLVDENVDLPKYVSITDVHGNILGEIQCYFIEKEEDGD